MDILDIVCLKKLLTNFSNGSLSDAVQKYCFFFFFFFLVCLLSQSILSKMYLVVPIVLGLVGTSWFPLQGQDMYNKAQSVQHQNVSGHHPSFNDGLGWKAYKEKRKTSKQYFRTASNKNLNPKPSRRIVS